MEGLKQSKKGVTLAQKPQNENIPPKNPKSLIIDKIGWHYSKYLLIELHCIFTEDEIDICDMIKGQKRSLKKNLQNFHIENLLIRKHFFLEATTVRCRVSNGHYGSPLHVFQRDLQISYFNPFWGVKLAKNWDNFTQKN